MIRRPTVLVLGAGASMDFGFPSGFQLLQRCCSTDMNPGSKTADEWLEECGFDSKLVVEFRQELANSGRLSVDAFLEHRPDMQEIGRASMALRLIPCERTGNVIDRTKGPTWYDALFQAMVDDTDAAHFNRNELTVVTFNYDRSLEEYLTRALRSSFRLGDDDLLRLFGALRIIHVHGQLGGLAPFDSTGRDFSGALSVDDIRKAAAGIRIIHEVSAADRALRRAREVIGEAQRVIFLGFGFLRENVNRLGLRQQVPGQMRIGTALGVKRADRERVQSLVGGNLSLQRSLTIGQFLGEVVCLDD